MPEHMWQILTTHDNTYLVRCHLHTKSPELQACLFLSVFWCLFPGVSSHHFGFKAKWPLAQKTTTGTAVSSGSSAARASISVCGMLMLPSTWPSSYLRCNGWCNLRLTICSHFLGGQKNWWNRVVWLTYVLGYFLNYHWITCRSSKENSKRMQKGSTVAMPGLTWFQHFMQLFKIDAFQAAPSVNPDGPKAPPKFDLAPEKRTIFSRGK